MSELRSERNDRLRQQQRITDRRQAEGERINGEFVAVVRELLDEKCPKAPAPLPLAQLVVRRSWKDHVVHLFSWPRRAWRKRPWPLRAFTHSEIEAMTGKVMQQILRVVIYVMPKDRRD